jgi:hypothetical protein
MKLKRRYDVTKKRVGGYNNNYNNYRNNYRYSRRWNNNNNNNRNTRAFNNNNTPEDRLFIEAILNKNYDTVKQYIQAGIDVNKPSPARFTPLFFAAGYSTLPIVKLLVEAGADITKEVGLQSPLTWAAKYEKPKILKYLLERCPEPCRFRVFNYDNQLRFMSANEARELLNRINMENNNDDNNNNSVPEYVSNSNSENNNGVVPRNNVNNDLNIGTCFDVLMGNESADAKEFLKEDKNNIILVLGKKLICLNRSNVKTYTQYFYECKKDNSRLSEDNVIKSIKYGKLMPYNQLVAENDLEKIQDKSLSVFTLNQVRKAKAFVAVDVMNRGGTFVSSDHCQEGSGGTIYELSGLKLKEGIDMIMSLEKGGKVGSNLVRK